MKTMKNIDSFTHVRGTSLFVDDLMLRQDALIGLCFDSPKAHGKIKNVNYTKAEALDGVVKIFTYKDILGENQIGGIIPDEPLWAEDEVHFWGQPIAFIVAESEAIAKQARALIEIDIEELPVITTAKEAKEKEHFINAPRSFKLGNSDKAFSDCEYVFEGETFSNGQEHLYLETQGCYAIPQENGTIKLISSTQGPTAVQKTAAKVLGIPMHKIEVDVIRLGGGFGGKEDQATPWAVMAAVAVQHLNRPIKYMLNRHDDLRMTGKRHPYTSFYKIGLTKDLKVKAFEVSFLQNSGAAADLSPAIAERTLFHATNSYFIPNVSTTVYSCKTNLPPNTAFRGFGGPQGMFVIESAIANAADKIGVSKIQIQEANLLSENDEFSYGQIATQVEAKNTWFTAKEKFNLEKLTQDVTAFNQKNKHYKKGISLMPITFGISFTNTPMNHARALVHIYQDGSVGISTGAVEMGQSVNTKMLQVAQSIMGISPNKIKLETTNTTRVANTSPTAASSTADLNGKAVEMACNALIERLTRVAAQILSSKKETITFQNDAILVAGEKTTLSWEALIAEAMLQRVALSENAHYATPIIHFDKTKEKGHPFAYHVYGTAITCVTVDCLRGTYEVDAVKIVHDFGISMNLGIDIGQIEGALAQGIGWMTMEEIAYNKEGKLLSNALSTYKVPDIFSAPKTVEIIPVVTKGNDMAIQKSKAVGEPPLMYGIGTYFAIQQAVKAFNSKHTLKFHAPFTPEKVLMALYETT
ncbi:xanthine dehydrogenase molybdopterin binding subunit [Tenacibaculum maritimum]|uniref:Xanthine dehydrogenase, molybdenum binding subunit n=2 Tax=Tenacibaculum maritimum TaxID=107401 RepID=A0A2H1E916_9FLAO|nr:molybdopterin cofactor-binding domain-containing protein [Tenacibaculum maritimum]MCD9583731.1 molybdopterin-dependent oxidoreductase [Tenacibaculum maritimum]MCD9626200.1 molybdopterin-dependent oxidoreductase [Tenacibaculum maritimum]MCD9630594.1 molybdopterin-dependent oxidoreductase [Tenacibaculum maritimum]MCD9631587.1 molybdopterin-dependent oxidoreductase [Tenacibaculum maritimum]SFZ81455.1 Xanthine dehydrogenase, molybdenum binding subunit [Tenacibaculum maritimum NCIMB 2154]